MKRFAHGGNRGKRIPLMELSGDLMESPVFLDDLRTDLATELLGRSTNCHASRQIYPRDPLGENRFPSESTSFLTSPSVEKKKKNEYPRVPYVNVNRRDTFGNTNLQRHFSSARRGRRDREKIVEIKGQAFFIARFRSVCEKTDSKFYFIVVLINF